MCSRGSDITFSPSPSVEEVLDSRPSRYDCAIEVASQRSEKCRQVRAIALTVCSADGRVSTQQQMH